MNSSKTLVIVIVLLILGGVFSWTWVNFTQSPAHNPEVAHNYIQHFDRRCAQKYDEHICDEVIGDYHRRCFEDHLEPTPPEELSEKGPVLYNRSLYMDCMRGHVADALQREGR